MLRRCAAPGLRQAIQMQTETAEAEAGLDQPRAETELHARSDAAAAGEPTRVAVQRPAEERQAPMHGLRLIHQAELCLGEVHPAPPLAIGANLRRGAGASPPSCDEVWPSAVPTATPTRPVPATGMSIPAAAPPRPE